MIILEIYQDRLSIVFIAEDLERKNDIEMWLSINRWFVYKALIIDSMLNFTQAYGNQKEEREGEVSQGK